MAALSHPLIFRRDKMQLEVGASPLSLSCDESCNGPLSMIRGSELSRKGSRYSQYGIWGLLSPLARAKKASKSRRTRNEGIPEGLEGVISKWARAAFH